MNQEKYNELTQEKAEAIFVDRLARILLMQIAEELKEKNIKE